jgi:hypothetical protein
MPEVGSSKLPPHENLGDRPPGKSGPEKKVPKSLVDGWDFSWLSEVPPVSGMCSREMACLCVGSVAPRSEAPFDNIELLSRPLYPTGVPSATGPGQSTTCARCRSAHEMAFNNIIGTIRGLCKMNSLSALVRWPSTT